MHILTTKRQRITLSKRTDSSDLFYSYNAALSRRVWIILSCLFLFPRPTNTFWDRYILGFKSSSTGRVGNLKSSLISVIEMLGVGWAVRFRLKELNNQKHLNKKFVMYIWTKTMFVKRISKCFEFYGKIREEVIDSCLGLGCSVWDREISSMDQEYF